MSRAARRRPQVETLSSLSVHSVHSQYEDDEIDQSERSFLGFALDSKTNKRRRDSQVLQTYERTLSSLLFFLLFLTVAVVALHILPSPTPGLYTKHDKQFTPVPSEELKHTACISETEQVVADAFRKRGWKIIALSESDDSDQTLATCHREGQASIIWTKDVPEFDEDAQPWQRHNWLPNPLNSMCRKSTFHRIHNNYTSITGQRADYVARSFVLPDDREAFLKFIKAQSNELGADGIGKEGAWIAKLSATNNDESLGIVKLDPQSPGLTASLETLKQLSDPLEYMPILRENLFPKHHLANGDDSMDSKNMISSPDTETKEEIIFQQFICKRLDFQSKRFDMRVYMLVASVNPWVVFSRDGLVKIDLQADRNFESSTQHSIHVDRDIPIKNGTISFDDWRVALKAYASSQEGSHLPPVVKGDPLGYVRKQIKAALSQFVAGARVFFRRTRPLSRRTENSFALMEGHFIIDRNLHIWMTGCQSSPDLWQATAFREILYEEMLPSTIDIVTRITEKQTTGQPLFPMKKTGGFGLIYTDDFQFRYDVLPIEHRVAC